MQKKRDFSHRERKYWIPKFDGVTLTLEQLSKQIHLDSKTKKCGGEVIKHEIINQVLLQCTVIIRQELEKHGEFVLTGVGRFYLLHGKSGKSFVKFSSKYTR